MHAVACAHLSVKRVDQRGGKTALPKRLTNSAKTKKYYGIKKLPYSFLMRLNTLVLNLEPQLLQRENLRCIGIVKTCVVYLKIQRYKIIGPEFGPS
jgi:hypothetical protein